MVLGIVIQDCYGRAVTWNVLCADKQVCVFQDTVKGNRLKSHYKQNFACRSIDSDVIVYVGLITPVM
jgi:hypothetical protein